MRDIGLAEAQLLAIFVESIAFGMFVVLYGISLWVLRKKTRTQERKNRLLIIVITIMMILAIAHLAIDLARLLDGFITNGVTADATVAFYANLSHPTEYSKTAIYVTQTLIGDAFVIYRTWVVWNRTWWVTVIPTLLLVGNAITGYGCSYQMSKTVPGASVFISSLSTYITAFFCMTFATNVICTLMIAGRLMMRQKTIGSHTKHSLWPVVSMVVESGAIYSAALIAFLIAYLVNSNGQYPALDIIQPLIGVTFSLILVRVGLGLSSGVSDPTAPTRHGEGSQFPMGPLSINVSRLVEQDSDRDEFSKPSGSDSYDLKAV
ncbi:hypothetical protein JAAARDRAFT_38840 [Jaapia argillacea MUCL 33604]|uniref:Uncharacterized protein n=1 Tax=Jaapia argillacea MUCL 33604 TaxID=933084 RepID=A0A067PJ59_9AGAM|nr:hypothetical protein JAAARDRAFT_38840 [Jaapia argillacea MUCL 33604]